MRAILFGIMGLALVACGTSSSTSSTTTDTVSTVDELPASTSPVEASTTAGLQLADTLDTEIPGGEIENLNMRLVAENPANGSTPVRLSVCEQGSGTCIVEKTTFLAPMTAGAR